MSAAELMEAGIRAYTHGQLGEAERCWNEALALEPSNDRARAYLALLVVKRGSADLPDPSVTPAVAVPLPPPPAAAGPAPAQGQRRAAREAPIPLPAPERPAWMRPPITLPPTRSPLAAPAAPPPLPTATVAREASPPAPAPAVQARRDPTTLSDYAPSPWDQGPARAPAVVLDEGVGLDLSSVEEQSDVHALVPESGHPAARVAPARPRSDIEVWMEGARELFALGDFSGSLEMIEKILKIDPTHAEARAYLDQNESTLIAMYESKLGPGDSVPRLAIKPEEVMWLNLDHRAGFLLAQIDATVSFEDLFALSGLPRLDTARILATLLQEGVITS